MTQTVQDGHTISLWETLTTLRCGVCNIVFAIPDSMLSQLKKTGKEFTCPNGDSISYRDNENERLRTKVESLELEVQHKQHYIQEKNHQITQLGYSVRALKAAKTKIINRVKNGVCPCCNRTFLDLQKHFKSKHPELLTA